MPKRSERSWTETQKQQALIHLEKNKGNIAKTSRELDIPRSTITDWRDRYEVIMKEPEPEVDVAYIESVTEIRHVNDKIAQQQAVDLLGRLHALSVKASDKLLNMIPEEEDMQKVTNALKVGAESMSKIRQSYSDDSSQPSGINLNQQINNYYK